MNVRLPARDLAVAAGDDYSQAFKILGMVVYVLSEGVEPMLSGRLVRETTFFRWVELLRAAGWAELICGGDYRQEVARLLARCPQRTAALSPQAVSHQASDAVKGVAEGHEAEPTLDGVADGGSLREATAPRRGGRESVGYE